MRLRHFYLASKVLIINASLELQSSIRIMLRYKILCSKNILIYLDFDIQRI